MAKYTNDDVQIKALNEGERTDYSFEVSRYNVDTYTEPNSSMNSLSMLFDTKKIERVFKDPMNILSAFLSLLLGIMFCVLILLCILLVILMAIGGSENEPRVRTIKRILFFSLVLFCISLFFYVMYFKILALTISTTPLAKE